MADWYSFSSFLFHREQMMWAIEHIEELRDGTWPREPVETGYTEAPISSRRTSKEAPFVKPTCIAAEVDIRLQTTSTDGKLLIAEIQGGKRISDLEYESRQALNYVSGWKRKRLSYNIWLSQRRYRAKQCV